MYAHTHIFRICLVGVFRYALSKTYISIKLITCSEIVYYVDERNYLLFKNSYMFRAYTAIIGPSTQYVKIR